MSDARLLLASFVPPRRTSFASSCLQWALPDLHCQLSIAVGLAGPALPALDRRASLDLNGESRSAVGLAARFGALWASPDLNRRDSARRGRPETKPYRMPKRMPDRMPDRMSEDMPDRMSEDISDRMSEDMTDRMPEDMLAR